jgi:hypothetical protein
MFHRPRKRIDSKRIDSKRIDSKRIESTMNLKRDAV